MNDDPKHTAPSQAKQRRFRERLEGAIALYLEGDIIAKVRLTNLTSSDSGIHAQVTLLHDFAPNLSGPPRRPSWRMGSSWQFPPYPEMMWSMPYVGFNVYFDPALLAALEEHVPGLSPELTPEQRYWALRQFISDYNRRPRPPRSDPPPR